LSRSAGPAPHPYVGRVHGAGPCGRNKGRGGTLWLPDPENMGAAEEKTRNLPRRTGPRSRFLLVLLITILLASGTCGVFHERPVAPEMNPPALEKDHALTEKSIREESKQDEPAESKTEKKTDQTGPAYHPGGKKILSLRHLNPCGPSPCVSPSFRRPHFQP
jgi:hypothetical protein